MKMEFVKDVRVKTGHLSQGQVAKLLGISRPVVAKAEKRALQKLRNHPLMRQLWESIGGALLEESP